MQNCNTWCLLLLFECLTARRDRNLPDDRTFLEGDSWEYHWTAQEITTPVEYLLGEGLCLIVVCQWRLRCSIRWINREYIYLQWPTFIKKTRNCRSNVEIRLQNRLNDVTTVQNRHNVEIVFVTLLWLSLTRSFHLCMSMPSLHKNVLIPLPAQPATIQLCISTSYT